MSAVTKFFGRILGVKEPKAPQAPAEEEDPTPIPTAEDPDIRRSVLEQELEARRARGRSYTRRPGRALGGQRTTLG